MSECPENVRMSETNVRRSTSRHLDLRLVPMEGGALTPPVCFALTPQ